MAAKNTKPAHTTFADSTAAVDDFMRNLDHPFKDGIEAIRQMILAADPAIAEGVKWNAPSFRTREYFATFHLRGKRGVGLILHLGAKARALTAGGVGIADPEKLLEWLGADRARVVFETRAEVEAKAEALTRIVRQWLAHV